MTIELILGIVGVCLAPLAAVVAWRVSAAQKEGRLEAVEPQVRKDLTDVENELSKIKDQMQAMLIQSAVDRANVQNVTAAISFMRTDVMGAIASLRTDFDKKIDLVLAEKIEKSGTHARAKP